MQTNDNGLCDLPDTPPLIDFSIQVRPLASKSCCSIIDPSNGFVDFSIVSWNCRTLCYSNPKLGLTTLNFLAPLVRRYNVICLQEVHGYLADFLILLRSYLQDFDDHFSPCADRGSGGVATLVRRKYFSIIDKIDIKNGRLINTTIEFNSDSTKHIDICNLHYEGFNKNDDNKAECQILKCISKSNA